MVSERNNGKTLDDTTLDGTHAKETTVDKTTVIEATVAVVVDARIAAAMEDLFR